MKRFFTLVIFLMGMLCIYAQSNIKMKGVDHIDKALLDQIIKECTYNKALKSSKMIERARAINVVHKDVETRLEIPESDGGRVRVSVNSAAGRPAITPFSMTQADGNRITDVVNYKTPIGYKNDNIDRLVVYLDEDLNITFAEANEAIDHNNTDKKYFTVYFLCTPE